MTDAEARIMKALSLALQWSALEISYLKGSIPSNPMDKPKFDVRTLLSDYQTEVDLDEPEHNWKGVLGV